MCALKTFLAGALLLLLCGCSSGEQEQGTHYGIGAGDVCFSTDSPNTVRLVFDDCASSCAEIEDVWCEATLDGDTIHVWGNSEFFVDHSEDCDTACREISATCELPEDLVSRSYTVDHHGVQTNVDLPADTCVEL